MCYTYAVCVQNLDVNMAVNNLLSRDDGEHEDHDEPFQGMFSSGVYVCTYVTTATITHLSIYHSLIVHTCMHTFVLCHASIKRCRHIVRTYICAYITVS